MSHHRTTAKQARIFFERACIMLAHAGAVRTVYQAATPGRTVVDETTKLPRKIEAGHARATYELTTRYGLLTLHVYDDWIPARFDRPSLEGPGGLIGKWNHHYRFERSTDLEDLDGWLEGVAQRISGITAPLPAPLAASVGRATRLLAYTSGPDTLRRIMADPSFGRDLTEGEAAKLVADFRVQQARDARPAPVPTTHADKLAQAKGLLADKEKEVAGWYRWRLDGMAQEVDLVQTHDGEVPITYCSVDPYDIEQLEVLIETMRDLAALRRVVASFETLLKPNPNKK